MTGSLERPGGVSHRPRGLTLAKASPTMHLFRVEEGTGVGALQGGRFASGRPPEQWLLFPFPLLATSPTDLSGYSDVSLCRA